MNRHRSTLRFPLLAFVACAAVFALGGCSDDTTTPVDGGAGTPADARADVASDTGTVPGDAASGDTGTVSDGGAGDAKSGDTGGGVDSGGDAGVGLTAARVAQIRACMDTRWGAAATRGAGDVADDFDACTTAAENTGDHAAANFKQTLEGWAEPLPNDASQMRKVTAQDH